MRIIYIAVLAILVGCASSRNPNIAAATKSFHEKDFQAAYYYSIKCFEETNDSGCAYNAGVAAQSMGHKDDAKNWFTLAARYGFPLAISALTQHNWPVPTADLLQAQQQQRQSEANSEAAPGVLDAIAAGINATTKAQNDFSAAHPPPQQAPVQMIQPLVQYCAYDQYGGKKSCFFDLQSCIQWASYNRYQCH